MKHSTLRKWKRDALEIEWDHKPENAAKDLVRQARRVTLLVDELTSITILHPVTKQRIVGKTK